MKIRSVVAVLLSSAALMACNGWPKAAELERAEHNPEYYPTYSATPAEQVEVITFENRRWMVEPGVTSLRGARLEAVGTAGHTALFARAGSQTPYPVLFASVGGTRYRKVVPIE